MAGHSKIQTFAPVLPEVGTGPDTDPTSELALTDEESLEESLAFKSLMEVRKKRRRRRIIIGAVAGVAVLGFAVSLILRTMQPVDDVPEDFDVTAFVERGDFVDEVGATGAAQPVSSVVVMPEVDGVIETVEIVEGQQVAEGDTLFTLRNEQLDRAITEAGEQVAAAQSALDSARREYANACDTYNATQGLDTRISEAEQQVAQLTAASNDAQAKLQAAQTKLELELNPEDEALIAQLEELNRNALQAQSALEAASATLAELKGKSEASDGASSAVNAASDAVTSAKAALASAQRSYDDAVTAASKRTVTAPQAGSVLVMNAVVGMDLGSAAGTGVSELVRIADFSQMRVSIQVNEVDISRIKVGQQATVTFAALPEVTCDAVVESVASVSGSGMEDYGGGVVTYKVELLIEHPDANIKPGMSASVTITTQRVDDTLIVPTTALGTDVNGNTCVTVVTRDENGEIIERTKRTVSVVAQNNSDAAIIGNVEEGDEILLGGGDDYDELGEYDEFGDEFSDEDTGVGVVYDAEADE